MVLSPQSHDAKVKEPRSISGSFPSYWYLYYLLEGVSLLTTTWDVVDLEILVPKGWLLPLENWQSRSWHCPWLTWVVIPLSQKEEKADKMTDLWSCPTKSIIRVGGWESGGGGQIRAGVTEDQSILSRFVSLTEAFQSLWATRGSWAASGGRVITEELLKYFPEMPTSSFAKLR